MGFFEHVVLWRLSPARVIVDVGGHTVTSNGRVVCSSTKFLRGENSFKW
jgi:hypothetical protein